MQFPVEEKLKKLVKDHKDPDSALGILIFPFKENFATLEQKNIFRLGTLVQKDNINRFEDISVEILEKIQKHIDEFGWINARGGQAEPWSEKEIFERIMHVEGDFSKKLIELEKSKIENREKTKKLLKELNADEKTIRLVDIAKELVYFRTHRTDCINQAFFNIKPLLKAIADERNQTYDELLHLRVKEIENNKKVEEEEIKRRMINFAIMTIEPNKVLFTSDPREIKKIKEKYCEEPIITSEVIGRSAFVGHGKVRGIVKVVINVSDLNKINTGDILVSPMTTPNFIIAMEKAAAFVTDEGGITCHAAIVAREMKKPCIIGTETATQVLKDGDIVEIDARKGIVRKIE